MLSEPHAAGRLSGPVLHQRPDLFLRHLVPDLSGQGAGHVDHARPASPPPRPPWPVSSAGCSAASSPTCCSSAPARWTSPARRRCCWA
ncbi:hypothetical protein ACRAWD_18605 [Caulobacter segnis]